MTRAIILLLLGLLVVCAVAFLRQVPRLPHPKVDLVKPLTVTATTLGVLEGRAPLTVSLSFKTHGGNGEPIDYDIDWGDGTHQMCRLPLGPEVARPAHTYTTIGVYQPRVTATQPETT